MSRPRSEAEYLARLIPPSASATSMGRRALLKGALGAGAALALPGFLAGCGGSSGGASTSGAGGGASGALSGTVKFGSNYSDAVPKKAMQAVADAFTAKNAGVKVALNTVDHNTFQENINNYLQGKPDDVFTWFAGYRMRFFAEQGLIGDLSDVWGKLTGFSDAFKKASTGDDGKQYLVPIYNYPWAVFYRPSLWKAKGYTPPKTLDEFKALSAQMAKDGLVPVAFADKDGWPAMGTFDILNMRINGYQFHVDLMAGKKVWNGPEVKKVFDVWTELLPLHQPDSLGRTWQEAAGSLQTKKAGMYLLGSFVAQQVDNGADLDFFPFPEIDPAIGADAIDAPFDGFLMSAKPSNEAAAAAMLQFLGGKEAASIWGRTDPTNSLANSEADTSTYSALQKKASEIISQSKSIAQFLDRDTRPDFASTVMIPQLQAFIKDPKNVRTILDDIEKQKKSIFVS
ncbi:MAG: multiple sugar transport system substrate-binding protein [Actinomycetota bacterium]|nr:multiple sugar transport system substrate-binding protein [Actinomycetota bacterium]